MHLCDVADRGHALLDGLVDVRLQDYGLVEEAGDAAEDEVRDAADLAELYKTVAM